MNIGISNTDIQSRKLLPLNFNAIFKLTFILFLNDLCTIS